MRKQAQHWNFREREQAWAPLLHELPADIQWGGHLLIYERSNVPEAGYWLPKKTWGFTRRKSSTLSIELTDLPMFFPKPHRISA
jgi:hypothetical protein